MALLRQPTWLNVSQVARTVGRVFEAHLTG